MPISASGKGAPAAISGHIVTRVRVDRRIKRRTARALRAVGARTVLVGVLAHIVALEAAQRGAHVAVALLAVSAPAVGDPVGPPADAELELVAAEAQRDVVRGALGAARSAAVAVSSRLATGAHVAGGDWTFRRSRVADPIGNYLHTQTGLS